MTRITKDMLDRIVSRINAMTGNVDEPWTKSDSGQMQSNIGNYHLSGAYGGYSLHQMLTESGGVRDVLSCGHVSKRELYDRMHAFIEGLYTAKDINGIK